MAQFSTVEKNNAVISSKIAKKGDSIFAVMTHESEKHNAINLSQGFPGFPVSSELIDLYYHYMKKGYNQYAPMPGLLSLREKISQKMAHRYGMLYDPQTEITITSGATQALFTAFSAFVNKGDEVVLFDPSYDSYRPAIELSGGIPVHIHLDPEKFTIPWDEVENRISDRTKMIVINTPHNPSGSVLTTDDLLRLEKICSGSNIIVVSDEVYEHIIFDTKQHQSVARFPKLASRSIIIYSFGKTFHATGWKLGYAIAPSGLMAEFRNIHQYIVFSANTPLQHALAEYMQDSSNYDTIHQMYEKKRNRFVQLLQGSRFKPLPCQGTYFLLLDYSAISTMYDVEFARQVTREYKVASIPVSVFYKEPPDQQLLRFCFAKDESLLEQAALRLKEI